MSLKQKLHYQTRFFVEYLRKWSLPSYFASWKLKTVVVVLVGIFGFAFIVQTNTLATSGYVINDLQNQIDTKTAEIQKIETKVASFQSMNSIQARLVHTELVPVDTISYIKVSQLSQVAER